MAEQVNAGAKLESIGTVKTVVGEVKAVDASGVERTLQAGDKVYPNETIVTAAGALVLVEFLDGSHLDLPSSSQIVLDTDVFNPANAVAQGEELTAEQIQEMIARGEDPTAVTEATAAGAGAGDEGGSSFIVVDYNNTQGNVTSGFDTQGIPGPESTTFTELPPVEDDAVPEAVPEAVPTVGETIIAVDEDDLGGREQEYEVASVSSVLDSLTWWTGNSFINWWDYNRGNSDEQTGDDLPDPSATTIGGNLNFSYGPDGQGNITLSASGQPVLQSGGQDIQYAISPDGHTLVGYVTVGYSNDYGSGAPGPDYSYDKPIFVLEITDAATGAFTFTLLGQLDHATGGDENNLLLGLNYTVTDGNGSAVTGSLTVNIDDDSPIIGYSGCEYESIQSENAYVPMIFADEDNLLGIGNNDSANGDENPWTPETGYTGPNAWLPISFGADGPAADNPVVLGASGITDQFGAELSSGGQILNYVWDAETQTLTAYAGETPVFTLTVEYVYESGAEISFELLAPLDHPGNDAETPEDNLIFNISYTATDFDGDSVTGTLAVNVDDDSPVASDTLDSVDEGADVSGILAFMAGADGATITHINGEELVFGDDGWSQEFAGEHGVLKVQADGNYSFTAQPDDLLDSNGADSFSFTVTDGDGDSTTANFDVTVNDVEQTVTIQVFAVVDGELVAANSVPEGTAATYVAHAVDPNGNIIAGATGTVDITFTDVSATGGTDYVSTTLTGVVLGQEFTTDALDDYIADNGETFEVNAGNYSDAATYENVAYGDAVTTTIVDDSNPDTPDTPDEPNQETVTIQVFAVVDGELVAANSVPEGTAATYVAHAVDPNGIIIAGATGTVDITFTDVNATGGTDYVSTTLTGVVLGQEFTTDALDDYIADNGETFEVNAGNYSDAATYENVAYGDAVTTTITDDGDVTTITLNDVSVYENQTITYSASVNNAPVGDLTITLNNGVVIVIPDGELTGTSAPQTAQGDDVYNDGDSFNVTIQSATGGSYEALDTTDTATVSITDTPNTVTATLTTSTTEISENGGSIVYTVTLSGTPGTVDPDTNLVFNLANGEQVTILAGQTSGTFTKVYTNAEITNQTNITNSISGVASGGTEYEHLITAGSTNVEVDYGVIITDLTPQAQGGDVIVDEDDLIDGTDTTKESTTVEGTFSINAPDGVNDVSIGGHAVITDGVFTATSFTTALGNTLSVTAYDANTGIITYSYTLEDNTLTHGIANNGENSVYENFTVTLTDVDNDPTSATLSVQIVDDIPNQPADITKTVDEVEVDTNLMIILDMSGSMDDPSGIGGTRLAAAKEAIEQLINAYDAMGDVMVRIVTFNSGADDIGDVWMTAEQAINWLTALGDYEGDGATDYDAALAAAQTAFVDPGKISGGQNVSYFLSDGEPTDGNGSNGITAPEEFAWEAFLGANDIKSYALGMGTGLSASALQPISYDGASGTELPAILVTDLTQLASVLVGTVNVIESGNLVTEGLLAGNFGADGAGALEIVAITHDGVTYTTADPEYNAATSTLTILTDLGGKLTVNFATGEYSYSIPNNVDHNGQQFVQENFTYTIADADGDQQSADLVVKIEDSAPVAYDNFNSVIESTLVSSTQTESFETWNLSNIAGLTRVGDVYSTTSHDTAGDRAVAMSTSGFSGAQGIAALESSLGLTSGSIKALLGTGENNNPKEGSGVAKSFTVNSADGTATIKFDWYFDQDGGDNDGAVYFVKVDGVVVSSGVLARETGGDIGANNQTISLTGLSAGNHTIQLVTAVVDVKDTSDTSTLYLDNVRVTSNAVVENDVTGNVITDANNDPTSADPLNAVDEDSADDPSTVTSIAYTNAVGASATAAVPATGSITVETQNGYLSISADGSYSYVAKYDAVTGGAAAETDVFTYTLTDSDGSYDTANLTIQINDAVVPPPPPPANFLQGTIVTNTNVQAQPVRLTFTDLSNPLNSFSAIIVLGSQGQQSSTVNFSVDVGFQIDNTKQYLVTMNTVEDGQKVIITDFTLEGVTILDSNGNIQIGKTSSADGINDDAGITQVIQPNPTSGSGIPGDDDAVYSNDSTLPYSGPTTAQAQSGANVPMLDGTAGNDTLNGDAGINVISGGSGDDTLNGNGGNDVLMGGDGNDTLNGGAGSDVLYGDAGNDILNGGAGDDLLVGGEGADTFMMLGADIGTIGAPAHDVIKDFSADEGDVLNVADLLAGGLQINAVEADGHLQLQFSNGSGVVQTIDLNSVMVADSTAAQSMLTSLLGSNNIVD